jgi:hypothetical protein
MKYLQLLVVLLLSASWAAAQNYPSQTNPGQAKSTGTGAETNVQGCLSGSAGSYMLTDKNGTSYHLSGDTAKLSEHVGHEIKVTGNASPASPSSSGTDSSKSGGSSEQTIEVSSVKHVAKTCQSGAPSH